MGFTTLVEFGVFRGSEQLVNIGPIARANDYGYNSAKPNAVPPLNAILQAYVYGILDKEVAKTSAAFHGVKLPSRNDLVTGESYAGSTLQYAAQYHRVAADPWVADIWQLSYVPSIDLLRRMYFRGNIDDKAMTAYMKRNHVMSRAMNNALIQQFVDIPNPIQAVGLGVVGALDPANLTSEELLAEMPAEYKFWATAAGAGDVDLKQPGGVGTPIHANMAEIYWAGHWTYPSLETVLAWGKRFRESPPGSGQARDPSGIIIDDTDILQVAQIQGIAPGWRDTYEAASFRIGSIRFLRTLAQFGAFDATDLSEALLDLGYRPDVADRMGLALAKQARSQQIKGAHAASRGWIVDAWENGVISTETLQSYWASQELTPEQIAIATADVTIQFDLRRVKVIIASAKKGYMRGVLSEQQARGMMEAANVDLNKINTFIDDWKQERLGLIPMQSISKLITYAKQGVISIGYLAQRLSLVDMDNDDIRIILADVSLYLQQQANKRLQQLEKQIQKQIIAAEKEAEKRLKALQQEEKAECLELQRAIKQAQQLMKQAQTQLSKYSSPAEMKKYLCQGLLTVDQAMARFALLGWPQQDIVRYLELDTNPCKPDKGAVPMEVVNAAQNWQPPPNS